MKETSSIRPSFQIVPLMFFILVFIFVPAAGYTADVTLGWDKPDNTSIVAGYHIYYGKSGTNYKSNPLITIDSVDRTSCRVTGLEEGQIYGFAATSFDSSGHESAFSDDFFYNVPVSDNGIIIDNGGQGTSSTGSWYDSSGLSYYGSTSLYSQSAGDTYTYTASISGHYTISLWWTQYETRSTNVPVQIYDGQQLLDTVYVNQVQNGGQWNELGTYQFSGQAKVVIVSDSSGYSTCADAVKFVPVTVVDSDQDGLSDNDEINIYGTDPNLADTDGDGINDGQEVAYWGADWNADPDGDGIINILDPDSDNDGVADGQEISLGLNPADPSDGSSISPIPSPTPTTVIIDNGDPGTSATGNWYESSGTGYYGSTSLWNQSAGDTYTYTASISGSYEVSLWWTQYETRSTNVPIQIYDGQQLLDTVYVNQVQNGGQWNVLGTYNFTGQAKIVIVSDSNSYSTCADAVKFDPKDQVIDNREEVILDNGGQGTSSTGNWKNSSGKSYYGSRSVYSQSAGDTYTYTASISGLYEVSMWWTQWQSRSSSVPVQIYDGQQLVDTVYVNQLQNGGKWNVLGTYNFTGQARIVIVSASSSFSTCADAVKFDPKDQVTDQNGQIVIDNGGPMTSSTGDWKDSSGKSYYGSKSVYSQSIGDTYTYAVAVSGSYEVSMWWTQWQSRSSSVPVQIYDGQQLLDTVYVNQLQDGGQWNDLGTYNFTGQARIVIVSSSSSYSTCADAVRLASK